jgi:hypothetical protein
VKYVDSLRTLWQKTAQSLSRYQQLVLLTLLVMTVACASLFITPLVSRARHGLSGQPEPQDNRIIVSLPTGLPEAVPTPRIRTADDRPATPRAGTPSPAPTAQVPPSIQWQDDEKLRRAASLLLLNREYDAAVELLLQESARDSYAFAFDKVAYGKAMQSLDRILLLEVHRLGHTWNSLSELEKKSWFGVDERDKRPLLETLITSKDEQVNILKISAALPEAALLCFMSNVHVELQKESHAHPLLLSLILDMGFPQDSLAREAYRQHLPEGRVDYRQMRVAPVATIGRKE